MNRNLRIGVFGLAVGLALGLLTIGRVNAQTLHSWSTGQVIYASDLNANFTALKSGKVGSGVTLVNSDVSASAAISHSKLATPALVPKAWAYVSAACTGSAAAGTVCTTDDKSGVTSITTNGTTGVFRLNLSYTPANANFAVFTTPRTAGTAQCAVTALGTSAPHATISCFDYTGAAFDVNQFFVLVMDS